MSLFAETVLGGEKPRTSLIGKGKFAAMLAKYPNGEKGILKPVPFATDSFRGIPKQETAKREVAMYVLDRDVLHFNVVPETLPLRWHNRDASIQKFIPTGLLPREVVPGLFDKDKDDWKQRMARFFLKVNLDEMLKVVVMDLITNNVDRHGRNILVDRTQKKVWAIDNGLAFGRYYRGYRSVFHKYLYYANLHLPLWMVAKLKSITAEDLGVLVPYLPVECIMDTLLRIKFILDHRDRLCFKRMGASQGLGRAKFPSYSDWFKRQTQTENDGTALVYAPAANVDARVA